MLSLQLFELSRFGFELLLNDLQSFCDVFILGLESVDVDLELTCSIVLGLNNWERLFTVRHFDHLRQGDRLLLFLFHLYLPLLLRPGANSRFFLANFLACFLLYE